MPLKVNAWTQWGKLKTVVVGRADFACFQPEEPGFRGRINNKVIEKELNWPVGRKKKSVIDKANSQLDNLASTLSNIGIKVLRPSPIDFNQEIKTPTWKVTHMFCCVCPRDVLITIGNFVIEASMSKRGRFFEYLSYKDIMYSLWDSDSSMKWKVAPKPTMNSDMYWEGYWTKFNDFDKKSKDEQDNLLYDYKYVLNEKEIAFDAADITRCGKDIFVQHSMTTNLRAIEWLRRELDGYVRVHILNFPYDKEPSHIDCTIVPLRPPRGKKEGILLTNPERPLLEKDKKFFTDNNWCLIDAPMPSQANYPMPSFCSSSKWLSMNLLSIDENTVVVEEGEKGLHDLLEAFNFKIIKVPYRDVFEFGGSIHCSTWDIEREDSSQDFFNIESY
jgi:glycine amidinotransferase